MEDAHAGGSVTLRMPCQARIGLTHTCTVGGPRIACLMVDAAELAMLAGPAVTPPVLSVFLRETCLARTGGFGETQEEE